MRTGIGSRAGKEDPVELDSALMFRDKLIGVGYEGECFVLGIPQLVTLFWSWCKLRDPNDSIKSC